MILTGPEIRRQVSAGQIVIDPYDDEQLNPNSYNYRLGPMVLMPADQHYDLRVAPLTLLPRRLYLGHTAEVIGSVRFVTMLNGRSSVGRLGLYLNVSADLGQLGPAHRWTLELTVVQPLRIHFGMRIGQATFWEVDGPRTEYRGEYAKRSVPTPNLRDARLR
jgi:dCTP deaminase